MLTVLFVALIFLSFMVATSELVGFKFVAFAMIASRSFATTPKPLSLSIQNFVVFLGFAALIAVIFYAQFCTLILVSFSCMTWLTLLRI